MAGAHKVSHAGGDDSVDHGAPAEANPDGAHQPHRARDFARVVVYLIAKRSDSCKCPRAWQTHEVGHRCASSELKEREGDDEYKQGF